MMVLLVSSIVEYKDYTGSHWRSPGPGWEITDLLIQVTCSLNLLYIPVNVYVNYCGRFLHHIFYFIAYNCGQFCVTFDRQ